MADQVADAPPEKKAPELCAECKAKQAAHPGKSIEMCRECTVTVLTFHGWIRDGVFYDTRAGLV